MFHVVVRLSVMTILYSVLVLAPFGPEHPYNILNPLIDPWWEQLDKKTQKEVYSVWTQFEPLLLALAKKDEMLARKVKVGIEKIKAWEALGAAKKKHLKDILKGEDLSPDNAEDDNKEDQDNEKTKTKVNLRTYVDERWEELQRLAQYKTHLYTSKLRAKYDALEEFVRLLKNKNYKYNLKIIKDVIKYAKYYEPEPEYDVDQKTEQSLPKISKESKHNAKPNISEPDPEPISNPEPESYIKGHVSELNKGSKSGSKSSSELELDSGDPEPEQFQSGDPEPEPER